jgi:16S rRNA (guanine(966)-N(2))-methyltransferase RsmD
MRVSTGSARGRKLVTPQGLDTRPTTDKVKEAVCSAIQFDFSGAKVIDLFAGSGQMAIEALSRGARHATLLDTDAEAIACISENVRACGFSENAVILKTDAFAYLQRCREEFDIAFLDPPYRTGILQDALALTAPHMRETGVMIAENPLEEPLEERYGDFVRDRQYRYGKIRITTFRHKDYML